MKKVLIVYVSVHHGNTEKVAKAMASVLKARLVKVHEINKKIFSRYNVIGFGSGIFFWRHHPSLLRLIDSSELKKKKVFIFSTRGDKFSWKVGHRMLKKKLLAKKCKIIGEFSCLAWDNVGPLKYIGGINRGRPNKDDLRNAENFARKIKNK